MTSIVSYGWAMEKEELPKPEQSIKNTQLSELINLIRSLEEGKAITVFDIIEKFRCELSDGRITSEWYSYLNKEGELAKLLAFPRGPFCFYPASIFGSTSDWLSLAPYEKLNVTLDLLLQWAIQHGVDLNLVDKSGSSILEKYQNLPTSSPAERIGKSTLIRHLIAHGAKIKLPTMVPTILELYGESFPLLSDLLTGKKLEEESIKAIQDAMALKTQVHKLGELLVVATAQGYDLIVSTMLENLHVANDSKWHTYIYEAFLRAAQTGNVKLVDCLSKKIRQLLQNANSNLRTSMDYNFTYTLHRALLAASAQNHNQVTNFLLEKFKDAYCTDLDQPYYVIANAFRTGVNLGHTQDAECFMKLLTEGAGFNKLPFDKKSVNKLFFNSAFRIALVKRYSEIAAFLLEYDDKNGDAVIDIEPAMRELGTICKKESVQQRKEYEEFLEKLRVRAYLSIIKLSAERNDLLQPENTPPNGFSLFARLDPSILLNIHSFLYRS